MRRMLIVLGQQSCLPEDPISAAERLGYKVTLISQRALCGSVSPCVERVECVDLNDEMQVDEVVHRMHADLPLSGIVAYDDQAVPVVARLAERLALPGHPLAAALAARDKA